MPLTVDQVRTLAAETSILPSLDAGPDHPATVGVEQTFALCKACSGSSAGRSGSRPEQEWVRAARGDDLRVYPWETSVGMGSRTWVARESGAPVRSRHPAGRSAFGLLDMAGNADELTSTLYAPFPGAPEQVPVREDWAHAPYITKGGGFPHLRDLARCDRRHGIYAEGEPLAIRIVVG